MKDYSTYRPLDIEDDEWERLLALNVYEEEARQKGFQYIAGLDEAGRGPLAGPVVAAVCLLEEGVYIPSINDSKQTPVKVRQRLFEILINHPGVIYAVGIVEVAEIDRINIYQATVQAMLQALNKLSLQPDLLLVDGMKLPHPTIPCTKIIKGDSLSQSIAAASIIAKETRDQIMRDYHLRWPYYGFNQHKGYGTAQHLAALAMHGPCEIHRTSFKPCQQQLVFEFE